MEFRKCYEWSLHLEIIINHLNKTIKNKITIQQNAFNTKNANKGIAGTNKHYAQNQGNLGKQLNTNNKNK